MVMPSVARINFIQRKVIFRHHTKGLSNQISSDHKIKSYSCSIHIFKMRSNEKMGKIFLVTKRGNKGITNWGRFQGLQIRARGITNRGSLRNCKLGQKDYKSGNGFQIGAKRFQIEAEITNRGKKDIKLGAGTTNRYRTTSSQPC